MQPRTLGCEECLRIGERWVHLRICLTCGHVGCCDAARHRHATAHFWATQHPSNSAVPSLRGNMRTAFWLGLLAYLLLLVVMLVARTAIGRAERRLAGLTDRAVEAGLLE